MLSFLFSHVSISISVVATEFIRRANAITSPDSYFWGGLIDCFGNFHSRNFLALLNYKNTFPFIGSCASVRLADNIKNADAFSGWCMTSKRSHDLCTIMQLLRFCSGMIIIVPSN